MSLILFENCFLIDGVSEEPRHDMQVVVENDRIREVTDQPVTLSGARRYDLRGKCLMPGLIDAHCHVYAIHLNQELTRDMPLTLMTAHAVGRVRNILLRGFTTIRDVAGGDFGIKEAIARGVIDGPRLFVSGRALSQTGGHGDHRLRTSEELPCTCTSALDMMTRIADGVDGVRRAVREELRKGADHVKVMVSGGVGSPFDQLEHNQYSSEELKAAVQEAQARNTYVAAHSYTSSSTRMAVECGVRSIEHGNFVDSRTAELMAQKGAFMVPTLICYRESADQADHFGLSETVKRKLAEVNEAGLQMLETCKNAGVKMGFGTDLMGELNCAQSKEFSLRNQVLRPMDILRSATSINAEILGQSGLLGCVQPEALADLIIVEGNPLEKIHLLEEEGRFLSMIMKEGRMYKNLLQ